MAYVARIAASEVTSVATLGKVSIIVIVTSLIVLSVAADWLVQTFRLASAKMYPRPEPT